MPRTVRDAADLVYFLGEQYLWVDALCINQRDAEEKQIIVASMGAIYRAAIMTIVATSGSDADAGLPGVHSGIRTGDDVVTIALPEQDLALANHRFKCLEDILSSCTWRSRAWTYQEEILSRRCMYFTPDEVFFACGKVTWREAYAYECNPVGSNLTSEETFYKRIAQRDLLQYEDYQDAVFKYASRNLTFPGDRLRAFSGILDEFTTDPDSMTHGLPIHFFARALRWDFGWRHGMTSTRINKTPMDADHILSLPSWSWAGWEGPVAFGMSYGHHMEFKSVDMTNVLGVLKSPSWLTRVSVPSAFEDERNYPTTRTEHVTLHLWTLCFHCRLTKTNGLMAHRPGGYCMMQLQLAVGLHSHIKDSFMMLDPEGCNRWDRDSLFEFALLSHDDTPDADLGHPSLDRCTAILIERHDGYAERIAYKEDLDLNAIAAGEHGLHWEHIKLR